MRCISLLLMIGLAAALLLFQGPARARHMAQPSGPAFQVKDINTQLDRSAGSYPAGMTKSGGQLFFSAWSDLGGFELWKTDGTAAGTSLVKDINPGQQGSDPSSFVDIGGTLFFSADDGRNGRELWMSDGSTAGTALVKDINPNPGLPSNPHNLINFQGTLFFVASAGGTGAALWRSDGTSAGTLPIKDIPAGPSAPNNLTMVGGTLFFQSNGQLWKSDGTPNGTAPFTNQALYEIDSLTDVNGTLFFVASDGSHGKEIWKSDGTNAGTTLIADLIPSNAGSDPRQLLNVNGTLFFVALYPIGPSAQQTVGLFKTDGVSVTRVTPDQVGPNSLAIGKLMAYVNGTLFFSGSSQNGAELWRTDGTPGGTAEVKDIIPGAGSSDPTQLTDVDGVLFFVVDAGLGGGLNHRPQLWSSDGSPAGTRLIKDLAQAQQFDFPDGLIDLNGTLLFAASDPSHGRELWRSDSSEAGTSMVAYIGSAIGASNPTSLVNVGETLYFVADDGQHGPEVWRSDGTLAGTAMVKDINPDQVSDAAQPENLTNVQGKLFFTAYPGPLQGLYASDGTAAGTILLHAEGPYTAMRNVNGTLYFAIGRDLWKSDGTPAGTVLVRSFVAPSPGQLAYISAIGHKSGIVYLGVEMQTMSEMQIKTGDAPAADIPGLWRSDGTPAGTNLVKQFGLYSRITNVTEMNGGLFFLVNDGQLWWSDGTASGTMLVKELPNDHVGSRLTNAGGQLIFLATPRHELAGDQLWTSDGTPAGTAAIRQFVYDYNCGDNVDTPLAQIDGVVFFAESDPATGCELWRSDGTIAGTAVVEDIVAGPYSSYPLSLGSVAGRVLFAANDGQAGAELWSSQGLAANTAMLQEIAPGPLYSLPGQFTRAGQFIFFRATDGGAGSELWAMPLSTFLNKYSRISLMRR